MPPLRKPGPTRNTPPARTAKKGAYHHGDLERALVDAAVDMIRKEGVEAFTLRSVGARIGVSRTALYRHFDDKAALLARVASEGSAGCTRRSPSVPPRRGTRRSAAGDGRRLRALRRPEPVALPDDVRRFLTDWSRYPDLIEHGNAAFTILGTIRGEQERGRIGPGDPIELAEITWSLSHGIATLGMAQHLARTTTSVEELAVLGCRFLQHGFEKLGIRN